MLALAARQNASALLSALCRSELSEGDVLVATKKQDCPDASDPSEHEH
jgi:hypothetical protein